MNAPDKTKVWTALQKLAKSQLDDAISAQKTAQQGATHEESKPENDKDTRGLESSYLARGLANRVVEAQETVARLSQISDKPLPEDSAIVAGALVALEDDEGETLWVAVAPAGGGLKVSIDGVRVTVATPKAPLGQALMGKAVGDEVKHPSRGLLEVIAVR